ncbi:Spy/CpxP family protein refolding chaperone [Bosea sp. 117]|uniref:Spy/CpxP family protein refolding chaperone n=1 Tax=Bosea sp. 117 TaxID=1125973 RepID=UPI00049404C5|nr:Spy/CpxP family protein refolding chaperone [Bosea sp. 117]
MKRTIIAATAAALLASVTFGIAAPELRSGDRRTPPSPAEMAENAAAMTDARIAALKAGLRMNAEQEKLWPAVESALRDLAKQRADRREERLQQRAERVRPDIIERMREQADGLLARGDGLKKLVDAADPLYRSLDPGQQRRFSILLREVRSPHMAEWRRGEHGGPRGRDGHGPRGPHDHHRHGPMPGGPGPGGSERL